MQQWHEDFSNLSLEEVLAWQAENRAWGKELRLSANDLVNSRLAKDISQDDYVARRKRAQEETAECRRRADLLNAQIIRRTSHA
jgi:hypothetical protein